MLMQIVVQRKGMKLRYADSISAYHEVKIKFTNFIKANNTKNN